MSPAQTRAQRRTSQRRSRAGLMIGAAVVLVAAVVVGAVLVSSGSSDDDGSSAAQPVADTNVTLEAGEITADSAGPPVVVSPELVSSVIATIGDYLEVATVEPIRTGNPVGDLAAVFDGAALGRVVTFDRAALVDEGIPPVRGDLDLVVAPVAITGLGDQDGNLVALTATLDLEVTTPKTGKRAPLHITRNGHFVLSPDAGGAWKVTAYRIGVVREGGGIDATTTTASAASGATP